MENNVIMSKEELVKLIVTMKQLDVRGFNSMEMLVSMVAFLNDVMGRTPRNEEAPEG